MIISTIIDSVGQHHLEDIHPVVSYHGKNRNETKPHHAFRNWSKYFQLPWFCFLDIAIFLLYLLFAFFHESSAISFSLDMAQAINKFFVKDINLKEPPIGIPVGNGQIFYVDDFLTTVNLVSERLISFPETFPILNPMLLSHFVELTIITHNKTHIKYSIPIKEINHTNDYVLPHLHDFSLITLSMTYHVMFASEIQDSRMNLRIISSFQHDDRTDTIFFKISHNRFQEKFKINADMLLRTFDYSLPFLIIFLNFITILITIHNTRLLVIYTRKKAIKNGLKANEIFWKKYDKWNIFSLITHISSISTSIVYIFIGQDIEEELPTILYFLSFATCCHSILLIRYLKLRESTMLIITVLYKSLIELLQFLLGCFPIFLGFWVFAICFWGHLSEHFSSPLQCASYLFCVMHGDSILGFYNSLIIQNDYSPYFGFFYGSLWVAFGLLLMFNVTISIVSDVLDKENEKLIESPNIINPEINMLTSDLTLITHRVHT
ncbi:hypothetical protein TRFO_25744 [Tritrichomonas foetus]|uniref:Polycystin cation channel PKD1/PKD2 domain-containing protein n=1 Tax=Tritrichomonas foetus TaxID=1144522 RepID=A0A1J4K5I7_9EUKA|nr:hypothetical protein TRFO_25744 [Tritrichomonas foetus]|eukprot:OHT06258.1 hypothetical protein TRFO_25744 [Tritrichomonas foetus]